MNTDVSIDDATVHYYDSDYPSKDFNICPENFDEVTWFQGLRQDVDYFLRLALESAGPILELCSGTGRIAIPMAQKNLDVTCVDISNGMLQALKSNIERVDPQLKKRLELVHCDATKLNLSQREFAMAFIGFNSLLCIPSFEGQRAVLANIAAHLKTGGLLALDIINPLGLKPEGDPVPRVFFTRKNVHTGNTYTRIAMRGALDADNKQELYGWYDEVQPSGQLNRRHYSAWWRPIFRHEIELMLELAGFEVAKMEGGHSGEAYTAASPRMLIQARKKAVQPVQPV